MKKTAFFSLFLAALGFLGAAETPQEAQENFDPPKQPQTFRELRSGAVSATRLRTLHSAQLVYRSNAQGAGTEFLMIRILYPGMARFDVSSPQESFTTCLNGKSSWNSVPDGAVESLGDAARQELLCHAAMMPIPLNDTPIFAAPKYLREETEDKKPCFVYETSPLQGEKFRLLIWIDRKYKVLRKAEIMDADGSQSVFRLRNYRSYNGIPLATRIYITESGNFYTMTLQSVSWNPKLSADLFVRPAKGPAMPEFIPAAVKKVPAAAKEVPDTPEIRQQKRIIRDLELKIKTGEDRLETMEKLIASNKDDISSLTASAQQKRSRTYSNSKSFRVKNYNSKSSLSHSGKKLIKQLNKENAAVLDEYQELQKTVLQMKIRLGDAQDKLAEMTAEQKKK